MDTCERHQLDLQLYARAHPLPPGDDTDVTMQNRRNYYRLLNVQSDAAPGVIKAAYRALVAAHHPDVGGDPDAAALLNEAYAVLSTPARRAAYDAVRAAAGGVHVPFNSRTEPKPSTSPPSSTRRRASGEHARVTLCPMCNFGSRGSPAVDARCERCTAPLSAFRLSCGGEAAADRRAVPRMSRTNSAKVLTDWSGSAGGVQMRDLSTDGFSFHSTAAVAHDKRIRVTCDAFDVVGVVVSARRMASGVFIIHARMLTAIFVVKTGGFVSALA